MAKRILCTILFLALLLPACACTSIYAAEYSFSEPYTNKELEDGLNDGTQVSNYHQLMTALLDTIGRSETASTIFFMDYSGSVSNDMAEVCEEVINQTPLGAYAVESMDYELSRMVSNYKASIRISYKRTPSEIRSVTSVSTADELRSYISSCLYSDISELAVRVYSSGINESVIREAVYGIYKDDPLLIVAEPIVDISSYPRNSLSRIYSIRLDFGEYDANHRAMKIMLENEAESVSLSLAEDNVGYLAYDVAKYLTKYYDVTATGRLDYTAYGALNCHLANSKGIAMAYKVLCSKLGIECLVVEGRFGASGTRTHFWNIIKYAGNYYHVDAARMGEAGPGATFLCNDAAFQGSYYWDTSSYPQCVGKLDYYQYIGDVPSAEED